MINLVYNLGSWKDSRHHALALLYIYWQLWVLISVYFKTLRNLVCALVHRWGLVQVCVSLVGTDVHWGVCRVVYLIWILGWEFISELINFKLLSWDTTSVLIVQIYWYSCNILAVIRCIWIVSWCPVLFPSGSMILRVHHSIIIVDIIIVVAKILVTAHCCQSILIRLLGTHIKVFFLFNLIYFKWK